MSKNELVIHYQFNKQIQIIVEHGTPVNWVSENEPQPPRKVTSANEKLTAERFLHEASEGAAFVWQGDFHKAKDLLQAAQKQVDRKKKKRAPASCLSEEFHRHRQAQAHRARILSRLLIPVDKGYRIPLPRAPDASQALEEAMGAVAQGEFVISLRELLGMIGAHEWRKKGVEIPVLDARIHPHYGVFSPVRGEYLKLVAEAPIPRNTATAFDIGTGTGVIALLLAKRGLEKIIATDLDSRALACAKENIARLGLDKQISIFKADLFPEGKADLIVCNPPWLPGRPTAAIENAIYDENSGMLRAFLNGVGSHLNAEGEAWLIISDLAERLGLRAENDLGDWIRDAGLVVAGHLQTTPVHRKAHDPEDRLHAARSQEITSLWRLRPQ